MKSGRVIQFSSAAFGLSGALRCVSVTHLYGHPHLMQLTVTPVKPERATATADTVTGSTAPLVTAGGGNGSQSAFVAVAKGEIGTTEQPIGSNQTKYGAWFGADGSPWCAIFVSWCAAQADIDEETMPRSFAAVGEFQEWFRQRGLFRADRRRRKRQPERLCRRGKGRDRHDRAADRQQPDQVRRVVRRRRLAMVCILRELVRGAGGHRGGNHAAQLCGGRIISGMVPSARTVPGEKRWICAAAGRSHDSKERRCKPHRHCRKGGRERL